MQTPGEGNSNSQAQRPLALGIKIADRGINSSNIWNLNNYLSIPPINGPQQKSLQIKASALLCKLVIVQCYKAA
ncbi:hypothetical protein [Paenibacillus albidus]|uniref:hypothetical protein n=1 Tax=Paenibacillus albidus TaxID=2041023 RepID=UPI001664760B|nr:hypothetical protein [Paenibacillus albidus]